MIHGRKAILTNRVLDLANQSETESSYEILPEAGYSFFVNRKITKILFVKSGWKIFDLTSGWDLLIKTGN